MRERDLREMDVLDEPGLSRRWIRLAVLDPLWLKKRLETIEKLGLDRVSVQLKEWEAI
jgi:hypothetical protein